MTLDSEEQRKIMLLLIDNATVKCGDGNLEKMYELKAAVKSSSVSVGDKKE